MTGKTRDNHVLMAVIGGAHGVRGQVRVKSHTGDPLALGDYGPLLDADGNRFEVTGIRPAKNVVIVTFRHVSGREAAERLNGTQLFIERSQLPDGDLDEDEFFIDDLVGLATTNEAGDVTGRVIAVHNFGADDMIEVRLNAGGRPELYPFTRMVVPHVDLDTGRLTLVPPGEVIARPGEDDAA